MTSIRAAEVSAPRRAVRAEWWRFAAIGLFLGLPLGAAALAILGLVTSLEASDRAEQADDTARAIIHQLDRRPGNGAKPLDTTTLFLASSSASLAQAELQALVSRRIEAAGARLLQLQPLEATDQDPPGQVAVEVSFDIGNAGLLTVLHDIETSLPILYVPRLDAQAAAAPDAQGGSGDTLRIAMTVQGTWRALAP